MRGVVLLVLAVLAAIGAGVGVEAGLAPATYGPPGARFRAAFPAPPHVEPVTLHGRGGRAEELVATGHGERLLVEVSAIPATGSVTYGPTSAFNSTVSLTFGTGRHRISLSRVRIGARKALLGAACSRPRHCTGVLVGLLVPSRHGLAVWSASATAPTTGRVRALLSSLRPLGR